MTIPTVTRPLLAALLILTAACAGPHHATPARVGPSASPSASPSVSAAARGSYNPAVTQATIRTTICVAGWTKTVRPPAAYTTALKIRQIAALHLPDTNPADYEEDHLVALELGGAPRDPANLAPQLWAAARVKDRLENRLHVQVCAGQITLAEGRKVVLTAP